MAPRDRASQRSLPLRQVTGTAGEQLEPALEPAEQRPDGEELHPHGRELDRERKAIEPAADLRDCLVRFEVRPDGPRPLEEELHRIRLRQRAERKLVLGGEMEASAAGREHLQAWRCGEQLGHLRRGRGKVLDVVEDEQQRPSAEIALDGEGERLPGHLL
jgi:hypothetical protein